MYVVDAAKASLTCTTCPTPSTSAGLAHAHGVEIGGVASHRRTYAAVVPAGVTETTVQATAIQPSASVEITPTDADGSEANGHQIAIEGRGEVAVTVTSADGSRTRTYRVRIERPFVELALDSGWNTFQWPGSDRLPVGDALRSADGADITDKVVAVYRWDEATGAWLTFFPASATCPA